MNQKIILISGFAGSGKTITGELLHEKLGSCARIESDFLILVKPFIRGENLSHLKIQNTVDVAHNFLKEKYKNLLIVGAIWNQKELDQFVSAFPGSKYDISLFWLDASKEIRLKRANLRQDPGDDRESIEETEAIIGPVIFPLNIPGGKFYKIDVGNKTPESIAQEIME